MPQYFAFLRAVNVGGRIVKMDAIRAWLTAAGLEQVSTFIASGNVLFHSKSQKAAELERRIEECLQENLGYAVETMVRTGPQLQAITAYDPFPHSAPTGPAAKLYVSLLKSPVGPDVAAKVAALSNETDELSLHGQELYRLCRVSIVDSRLSEAVLARTLGCPSSARNITTLRRLVAKIV